MKFFEPSKRFLDWLAKYANGRIVFDVGCGEGHVLKALRKRGVRAIGIDPLWDWSERDVELCSAVLPVEAETCKMLKETENTLAIFCRPCHSGFVTKTIQALPKTSESLYISLEHNLKVDIDPSLSPRRLTHPKCPEENVWSITK
jgi:SAM-dependent methyltransferase